MDDFKFDDLLPKFDDKKKTKEAALELQMIGRAYTRAGQWYMKELRKQDLEMEKKAQQSEKKPFIPYKKKKDLESELKMLENKLKMLKGQ